MKHINRDISREQLENAISTSKTSLEECQKLNVTPAILKQLKRKYKLARVV